MTDSNQGAEARQAETIICDGCHFSFEVDRSMSTYCLRCKRMAAHLGAIGDKELRRKALKQLLNFWVLSALLVGIGIGVTIGDFIHAR